MSIQRVSQASSLADILEKILDKGVVVAGDIKIALADVELLTIKIRLIICSVDKAMEIGINWWQYDPELSNLAKKTEENNKSLNDRVKYLEEEWDRFNAVKQERF